jgi:hypothetical protein
MDSSLLLLLLLLLVMVPMVCFCWQTAFIPIASRLLRRLII